MTINLMAPNWEEVQPNWRADDMAGAALRMKGIEQWHTAGIAIDSV
jgi:hypothetical protein